MRGLLTPGTRRQYALAGNATLTIQNPATENRLTFKIRIHDTVSLYFVRVLNGPDNTSNYIYVGTFFPGSRFKLTSKSRVSEDSPSYRMFEWFTRQLGRRSRQSLARRNLWPMQSQTNRSRIHRIRHRTNLRGEKLKMCDFYFIAIPNHGDAVRSRGRYGHPGTAIREGEKQVFRLFAGDVDEVELVIIDSRDKTAVEASTLYRRK